MRYQDWWFWVFDKEFREAGFDVHVLGKDKVHEMMHRRTIPGNLGMFSPIDMAIEFECAQIEEYMALKINKSDILFLSDISFPGLFCNVLFHKKPDNMFAFCHATSINKFDYFAKNQDLKFPIETAHSKLFNKIFVGSQYHADKLGWENTVVTYLPFHPFRSHKSTKVNDIISASRPTPQKVDMDLEREVEEEFSKIERRTFFNWDSYFNFLSESKILLITSHEDTFGYQIVDAVMNDCIPIAPLRCAYPELLPRTHLYESKEELFMLIEQALWGHMSVPKLLCRENMKDFYNKIINEIIREEADYPF